jgi:hypothetical protein
MNRDDIIRMAEEAGIVVTGEAVWKLCEIVAAAEREACAKLCKEIEEAWPEYEWKEACRVCASDIRARGEK